MINYEIYDELLKSELVVATGCTEPIAISFAANSLRRYLGNLPQKVYIYICGNIIKNAKSVAVPNTKGLKGIVLKGVDNTIRNVGRLAIKCMKETDKEIISMMIGK